MWSWSTLGVLLTHTFLFSFMAKEFTSHPVTPCTMSPTAAVVRTLAWGMSLWPKQKHSATQPSWLVPEQQRNVLSGNTVLGKDRKTCFLSWVLPEFCFVLLYLSPYLIHSIKLIKQITFTKPTLPWPWLHYYYNLASMSFPAKEQPHSNKNIKSLFSSINKVTVTFPSKQVLYLLTYLQCSSTLWSKYSPLTVLQSWNTSAGKRAPTTPLWCGAHLMCHWFWAQELS